MRRVAVGVLVVLVSVVTSVLPVGQRIPPAGAVPTIKSQIQYVVVPHPDDEAESWAMIANSSANYPVFILLTHGDHSSFCQAGTWRTQSYEATAGELPPIPEPVENDLATCDLARMNSWHGFLDQMAVVDPYLDVPAPVGTLPITVSCSNCSRPERLPTSTACTDQVVTRLPVASYELYVGVSSARMVFDFGDCDLTALEVGAAIRQARANTAAGLFPLTTEYGVIGAAYYNSNPACSVYTHPDHLAVHTALWNTDFGLPGPQWGRTSQCDTDPHRDDTLPYNTYLSLFEASSTVHAPGRPAENLRLAHRRVLRIQL